MKQPLLSIVVPTKNRYKYLYHLINLISSFESEEVEMVIQDNSDDNTEFLTKCNLDKFPFVKYFRDTRELSQADNAELSILNSTGRYVCFIGDDDGVTDGIIEQVKTLEKKGIEAMITRPAVYNWPDYQDNTIFNLSSTLLLERQKGNSFILNSKEELRKVAKKGFFNLGKLPKVYQGVVSRAALDRLFEICGSFFPGPSPDMANAVALTSVIDNYLYSDSPTIITGQSKFVGGGERLLGKLKPLTEIPQLPKDIMNYWDVKLPSLWCTDTIWPGSASIAALRVNIHIDINYDMIYGRFIFNHPTYSYAIEKLNNNALKVQYYKYLVYANKIFSWFENRWSFYMSNKQKIKRDILFRNLQTINEAATVLKNI